jgi:hypothetical protein
VERIKVTVGNLRGLNHMEQELKTNEFKDMKDLQHYILFYSSVPQGKKSLIWN